MSAPKITLQGNVQSLFGELDSRAHKVRVLADLVGESLTNDIGRVGEGTDRHWRLPYREGTRVQDLALIVVDEANRLIDDLEAARVFYAEIETATAEPDPATDPFLAAINRYRAEGAAVEAWPDDAADEAVAAEHEAILDRLFAGQSRTPPPVTSMAGAVAGIQQVFAERPFCDQVAKKLLRAVLAFLEGRASL